MKTNQQDLITKLQAACKKIAPVWPLENFVAVNPYMGLADKPFEQVADLLSKTGGISMTLPTTFYLEALNQNKMSSTDIEEVIKKSQESYSAQDLIKTMTENQHLDLAQVEIKTVADVALDVTGKNWDRFVTDRISSWASAYFDEGQALWSTSNKKTGIYQAWKEDASVDRTPKMMGLKGFHHLVKTLPAKPEDAAIEALAKLDIPEEILDNYLHRLLLRVGGWSAYAAKIDWDKQLYGGQEGALLELLSIMLSWESCMLDSLSHKGLPDAWSNAKMQPSTDKKLSDTSEYLAQKLILQNAFDLANQRELIQKFGEKKPNIKHTAKPQVQAVFCIDVRSEVYRRNLESVAPEVATMGFAGFFAFPIKYIPLGHEEGNAQCPVLLPTGPNIKEQIDDKKLEEKAISSRKLTHAVARSWSSFKLGAISCFSFVGPVGLAYLPKLFTDSFGLTRPVPHPDSEGISKKAFEQRSIELETNNHDHSATGIPLDQRIQMGKNALKAMSLTSDFARLVLIVGHGSTTVNNPHATGLDCGACGGHTGEANARVAVAVLNDLQVRKALHAEGIQIPDSTHFVACQHDTTTDEVAIFGEQNIPASHASDLQNLKKWLHKAGQTARAERAIRMQIDASSDVDNLVKARSKDWAQVRPEWGLAGCSAFVVAPRSRTANIDLKGRSFLHSYEWKQDEGFGVLELIMTAPMVVTSWINLQYYASTVDNLHYGSGNKTLHNVTAGIGVLEGYAGDLRVGLPWQSVHDGAEFQHEPQRLNVIIEAPIEAMNTILEKHESVRQLCDNGWIFLMAMNEDGSVSHRYNGNLKWEEVSNYAGETINEIKVA